MLERRNKGEIFFKIFFLLILFLLLLFKIFFLDFCKNKLFFVIFVLLVVGVFLVWLLISLFLNIFNYVSKLLLVLLGGNMD